MKLYRFAWSPFAHKVEAVLHLLGVDYESVDVSYGERNELAELTGGYIYVPVLVDDEGQVICDSRAICAHLLSRPGAAQRLCPEALEAPIWAYHDFSDAVLEDLTFRIASPYTRRQFQSLSDRALYTMNKERKFGAGCIDGWERDQPMLLAKTRVYLEPSLRALQRKAFLFGERPTLADAALVMHTCILQRADPALADALSPALAQHRQRLFASRAD